MATIKKNKNKKRVYRFFQEYNNINLMGEVFSGVRIILHETIAESVEEALDKYKLHIMTSKKKNDKDTKDYIKNLFGGLIHVEIIDAKTTDFETIQL